MSSKFNRRDFFRTTAVASAAALLPAGLGGDAGGGRAKGEGRQSVQVHHEWGTLKEALVGIPYLRIPQTLPESLYKKASAGWIRFLEARPGKTLDEAYPGLYARMAGQMDAAARILEDRGVRVHRPAIPDRAEEEYLAAIFPACACQFFPRDPLLVIGNHVIETELSIPYRRRERFGIRRGLADRLAHGNGKLLSMPTAMPACEDENGRWGAGPFLEGGDVLLLGRDIYVGVSGNGSNWAGVRWLAQYLGDSYRVHGIRLSKRFLHLDCCLSTPRPGLAIICREAFTDGVPEFLKGWQLIELSFREAKRMLATNGLILDEKTIIIGSDLPDLSGKLRAAGQEVIETPFDAVCAFAGSFRCWHAPLVRVSAL